MNCAHKRGSIVHKRRHATILFRPINKTDKPAYFPYLEPFSSGSILILHSGTILAEH
jgi:hypothetical protein